MKNVIILIIDDDEGICNYLKKRLESLGCRIEVAYSLNEGLALMATLHPSPSFIFLDLHFKKEDIRAEQTLQYIHKFYEINPQAAVVIITGMIDEKIQQMANALGAAFRQKPDLHNQESVWNAIEEAIERGKQVGHQPYEITTKMIEKIAELRHPSSCDLSL